MSDNTTPVNMNVNKFLSKTDFGLSLTSNVVWPWPLTHFIRRGSGRLCHTPVDSALEHFIVTLDKSRIASLLNDPSFWCKRCSYCVYQHYTPEECDYCWLRHIRREVNGVSQT